MGFNEDLVILEDGNRGSSKHTTDWHCTILVAHNMNWVDLKWRRYVHVCCLGIP